MIDLDKYNRYNFLVFNQRTNKYEIVDSGASVVTTLLDSFGLERIKSKFATDFDFFINYDFQNYTEEKTKFSGHRVFHLMDIAWYFLDKRQSRGVLRSPKMHNDILPMITSPDVETYTLGHSIFLKEVANEDLPIIQYLVDKVVWPYTYFRLNIYQKEKLYLSCKDIWPLFKSCKVLMERDTVIW